MITLAVASPAAAQHRPAEPARASARDPGPRVRLNVGYTGGFGFGDNPGSNPALGGGALGVHLGLGLQANDRVGAYLHVSGTSALIVNQARGAAMVDYTFGEHVTLGTGVSFQAFVLLALAGSGRGAFMAGVPLQVALNFGTRGRDGRRHAFSVALAADLGVAFAGSRPGFGVAATLHAGYAMF